MSVVVLCVCQHLKSSLMLNEDHFMDWNERCCFVYLSTFEKLINAERGSFYGLKWLALLCLSTFVVLCICQHLKSSLMLNEDYFMDWNERCCFVCLSTFEKLINAERGLFYGLKMSVVVEQHLKSLLTLNED